MEGFGPELAALYARDLTRLVQELRAFPGTSGIWKVAPGIANAAGTLALHLEGNLREYVGRQIGGLAYERDRPLEFSAHGVDQAELVRRIEAVRVSDNLAIVMGGETVVRKADTASVTPAIQRRFTNIWRRSGETWRMIARQATVVPGR